MSTSNHKNPQQAFAEAIASGRLSNDPGSTVYVGHYKYVGSSEGVDKFQHIETRRYLAAPKRTQPVVYGDAVDNMKFRHIVAAFIDCFRKRTPAQKACTPDK